MSVLSLLSDPVVKATFTWALVISLLPKQIILSTFVTLPDGEVDLPAFKPKSKLLSPVVTSAPALRPAAVLYCPVLKRFKQNGPRAVLCDPV